ncbi:MAG: response regulator [Gaiellaceae bacterium]
MGGMAYEGTRGTAAAQPEWLTLGQAAKYLGVAQSTMRKWSDLGRVSAFYTPGGHRRYRRSDLDQFLDRSGPTPAATGPLAGPLVLIVDDDERMREYVRVNLEVEGYEVKEAGSAEDALAALGERSPDLILLDVMMPQVDGWETLRRIQEHTGIGAIPVIMFSGKIDEQSAAEAESRGAQAFIGKPFDPRSLIESTKQQLPV